MFKMVDWQLYRKFDLDNLSAQDMIDLIEAYYSTLPKGTVEKIVPNFQILVNMYGSVMQSIAHLPEWILKKIVKHITPEIAPTINSEEFPV